MEVISYSAEDISQNYPGCAEIQHLIKAIEKSAKLAGKVVCTVEVNGMLLTEDDEVRLGTASVKDVKSLKVSMEETQKLISDTIINLRAGLSGVRDRCVRVADLVRENPAGPAQFEFSGLMEQTKFLTDALGALKPRLINNSDFIQKWQTAERKNRQTIRELLQAFKTQDFTLVSDVLEYEMHNLMEVWIEVIDQCDFD
jgi:hypothetical protein